MSRVNRASTLLCFLFPPTLSPTLSHIADDYTSHHQYCIGHALPSLFPPCLIPCRVPFCQKSMSFLLYDFIYRRAAGQTPIDPSRRERHLHKHEMSLQNTPSFALLRPEHSLTNHSVVAQAQMASATGQTQIRLTTFPFFLQETHYTEKRKGCANYGIPCKKGHPPFQKLTRNTPCYGVGVVSKARATNNTKLRMYRSKTAAYGDCGKTPSRGLRPDRSIAPGWPLHSAESAQQKSVMVHG